ncbi:unnamed protein product [Moneuplotes crassus]|uniref:Uncharacterized protein n=1 Tax=Euplotes crassus TaxID=5936 RepID=A0AAD2CXY9_EUPCR|nr:unnamed protein product [Moneuplotes crassus]
MIQILTFLTGIALIQCIPTQRRTSLLPYSFVQNLSSPEYHYSFNYDFNQLYQEIETSLGDPFEEAYFDVRQDEIFYFVRRSKLDYHRFKLVRYNMLTNTQGSSI